MSFAAMVFCWLIYGAVMLWVGWELRACMALDMPDAEEDWPHSRATLTPFDQPLSDPEPAEYDEHSAQMQPSGPFGNKWEPRQARGDFFNN